MLAELARVIGGERVVYPQGGEDALLMMRREALARTLWTRGVIDGDMTAIKLLVELLEGKVPGDEVVLNADQLAAAEAILMAWQAERRPVDEGTTKEANDGSGIDARA